MSELCLKDKTVLTLKDTEGIPKEIIKINAPELLPVFLTDNCTNETFLDWMTKRNIPEKREHLEEVTARWGKECLDNKNYASLSDQYWIKKRTETWKKVNFFNNVYSKDIGDAFFTPWALDKKTLNTFSPDLTTNGVLVKRWIQDDKKVSYLVKAGSVAAKQDPLSEVLVSVLCEKLGIANAGYDLHVEGMTMCSKCKNFITENTELVPASAFYFKEDKGVRSTFTHLLYMCEKMDIPDAEQYLNQIIYIDTLTGNEDRNLGNIAFIRDINTMKFIGPAPIFDCGNAYWSTKKINDAVKSKLFGDIEEKIFNDLKKKYDMSFLMKDYGYKKIIWSYPYLTETKKENLVAEISKRNNRICNGKTLDEVR